VVVVAMRKKKKMSDMQRNEEVRGRKEKRKKIKK